MLGCGFISPCSDEDTAQAISPSSSKCDWNDARQRCEFEISPIRRPARSQLAQRRRDVVVQLEVLAGRPLVVDLAGAGVESCPTGAHLLEDVAGVSDENLGVVYDARRLIENRRRAGDRALEGRDLDLHPVSRGEPPVTLATERRPGINQREVDVEENGAGRHSWYGPATTIAARSGSSTRRAAAFASSSVTAASSDGSRTS